VSGICGWYGDAGGSATEVINAMQRRFAWRHPGVRATAVGTRFGLAAVGPPRSTNQGPSTLQFKAIPHGAMDGAVPERSTPSPDP